MRKLIGLVCLTLFGWIEFALIVLNSFDFQLLNFLTEMTNFFLQLYQSTHCDILPKKRENIGQPN